MKLVTADHGHMWIDITKINDFYRIFLCTSCDQRMSAPRSWTRMEHRFEGDTSGYCVLCSGRVEFQLHAWTDLDAEPIEFLESDSEIRRKSR